MAVRAPSIPPTLDWVNTGGAPIALSELRGRVVLLDFWTMGCINCIHIIPALRQLEARFGDALAIIGVHSGKFTYERDTAAIRDAVVRLGVDHPVVNDRHFRVWREYAVRGWPSIVLLDARGYVVHQAAGEFEFEVLAERIAALIEVARGERMLDARPFPLVPERSAEAPGILRYPGKIAVDGNRVAIADTGHHRVLVGKLDAGGQRIRLTTTIGDSAPGFRDGRIGGEAELAQLRSPQGVSFAGARVVIADSGNHAVRVADLAACRLTTLIGTGRRVRTRADRDAGAIASPWDVDARGGVAHLAMAGAHQLWAVPLDGAAPSVVAGSGAEELHDALPHEAALAQPMAVVRQGTDLWFADAESSAVRRVSLDSTSPVTTFVGTGLFDFGDRDGVGEAVRLQHPQGLAVDRDGSILIADSYNGAIKRLDPATGTVRTLHARLRLPSALALAGAVLLIVETGAHRIMACHPDAPDRLVEIELEIDPAMTPYRGV